MLLWLKKHWQTILTVLVTSGLIIFMYACESKVRSLNQEGKLVTRMELQLELEHIVNMAEIRVLDLDRQDAFKAIILQNALILVQGQPLNPVGIIIAMSALYGAGQLSNNVAKTVKNVRDKKRINNG